MVCNLEIDVGTGDASSGYPIAVRGPGGGEASGLLRLDVPALLARRGDLQNSVLASTVPALRGGLSTVEAPVRDVGQLLFAALFREHVYGQYSAARAVAAHRGEPLRVVLRLAAPELAVLPWEMLYDGEHDAYVCKQEPLIRHVAVPTPPPPVVAGRLRVLGLVASPAGLRELDVDGEKARLAQALAPLRSRVELRWAPSGAWDDLRRTLTDGPWHVLHFIGHGRFDAASGHGMLALEGDGGRAHWVQADRIRDLISIQSPPPRLVVLNSCASGEAGADDLFSSTAATIVRGGACAVVAMQFAITDDGAKAFAESLYQAMVTNHTISESVRIARIGIEGPDESLEWATPVLYLRGDDAQDTPLFALAPSIPLPDESRPGPAATARVEPMAAPLITPPRPPSDEPPSGAPPSGAPPSDEPPSDEPPSGAPAVSGGQVRTPSRGVLAIVAVVVLAVVGGLAWLLLPGAGGGSTNGPSPSPTQATSAPPTAGGTTRGTPDTSPPVTVTSPSTPDPTVRRPPGPVGRLVAAEATTSGLTITWSRSSAADGYHIGWQDGVGGLWLERPDLPAEATSVSLTGLLAGHTYTVRVTPFNAAGDGTARTVTATTQPEPTPTPTGSDLTIGDRTPTTMTVYVWPATFATHYRIEYGLEDGNGTVARFDTRTLDQPGYVTLDGLSPGGTYTVRVTPFNEAGNGPTRTRRAGLPTSTSSP